MNKEEKRLLRRNLSRLEIINCEPCVHKACDTCSIFTQRQEIGRKLMGVPKKQEKQPRPNRVLNDFTIEQYMSFKADFLTDEEITKIMKVSKQTLNRWKIRNGLTKPREMTPTGSRLKLKVSEYLRYKDEGLTDVEIAQLIPCDSKTLTRWKSENGVKYQQKAKPRLLKDFTRKEFLAFKDKKLNNHEIAKLLGVSYNTLREWKDRNDIYAYRRKGKERGAYKR